MSNSFSHPICVLTESKLASLTPFVLTESKLASVIWILLWCIPMHALPAGMFSSFSTDSPETSVSGLCSSRGRISGTSITPKISFYNPALQSKVWRKHKWTQSIKAQFTTNIIQNLRPHSLYWFSQFRSYLATLVWQYVNARHALTWLASKCFDKAPKKTAIPRWADSPEARLATKRHLLALRHW